MDGKRDILEEIARLPETERVNERLIDDIVAPQNEAKTPRGGTLAIPRPALLGAFAVFAVLLAVLFFWRQPSGGEPEAAAPPRRQPLFRYRGNFRRQHRNAPARLYRGKRPRRPLSHGAAGCQQGGIHAGGRAAGLSNAAKFVFIRHGIRYRQSRHRSDG